MLDQLPERRETAEDAYQAARDAQAPDVSPLLPEWAHLPAPLRAAFIFVYGRGQKRS